MEQIGYSLIDKEGKEIAFWGDISGQCAGFPSLIQTPDGTTVHCPEINKEYSGCKIVLRVAVVGTSSGVTFDGEKIVATKIAVDPDISNKQIRDQLQLLQQQIDDLKKAAKAKP